MKLTKYLFGALAALALTACNEKAVDDLQGIYPAPTDITFTKAVDAGIEKPSKTIKIFTVNFTDNEGNLLSMKLVGDQYFVHSAAYTPANAADAKKGNYILGQSTFAPKGGAAVAIDHGSLIVEKEENGDNYTVSGTLWLANGDIIRTHGGGTIIYEPTDPTYLPELKSAQNNYDGTVTATFTTGGYTETLDMTTYQMVYTGEGNDWQVVFNSADGKLHPGTYSPGTGYKVGGQETVDWGWGPMLMDVGTIWYTIANGAKTPQYITSGDIVVTKEGPIYTILLDQGKGKLFIAYEGPIADLDPDGSFETVKFDKGLNAANYLQYGSHALDIVLGNGDLAYDAATWSYTGSGDMIQIEVYTEAGELNAGEYAIANDDASFQAGTFRGAYDGFFGLSATYVNKYTSGAPGEPVRITDGKLTVSGNAGSPRTFTLIAGDKIYTGTVDLSAFGL